MSGWTIAWLCWGAAFALIEFPALFLTRSGSGTLSVHVWGWFATARGAKGPFVRTRRLLLLAALAWLTIHLLTGGWI